MKKLLLAFSLLAVVSTANAQWHHHGHHRGGYGNWIAPVIIGGVIGYELNRPRYYEPPVIVQQTYPQSVVIQQHPVQNCTPWTEVQNADGTITRTRTCNQ